MNHRQLVNIIRYSDLRNGEAVIKIGDEIIELRIQNLEISLAPNDFTQVRLTGLVRE
jgi:hypothetical protein